MKRAKNLTTIVALMMVSLCGITFPSGSARAAVNTMSFESDWFDLEAGAAIPPSIPPLPFGIPPTAACDFYFGYNSHRVPHAVIVQNRSNPYPGVQIAYSDEAYADVTYSDVAGLAFTTDFISMPFDKVAVLYTTEGNYFKVGPVSETDSTVTFEWDPLFKMLGDVVVDGQTQSFDMYDVIHNLKVKNGGRALGTGSTIQNDATIEGSGS